MRTIPNKLERNVETISTTVALKAECACDGRSERIARVSSEARLALVCVGWESSTPLDSTGVRVDGPLHCIRYTEMVPASSPERLTDTESAAHKPDSPEYSVWQGVL